MYRMLCLTLFSLTVRMPPDSESTTADGEDLKYDHGSACIPLVLMNWLLLCSCILREDELTNRCRSFQLASQPMPVEQRKKAVPPAARPAYICSVYIAGAVFSTSLFRQQEHTGPPSRIFSVRK